jgi:hypothetical protein
MDAQVIEDQETLSVRCPDQGLQELNQLVPGIRNDSSSIIQRALPDW